MTLSPQYLSLQMQFGHLCLTINQPPSDITSPTQLQASGGGGGQVSFILDQNNPGKVWNPNRAFQDWKLKSLPPPPSPSEHNALSFAQRGKPAEPRPPT